MPATEIQASEIILANEVETRAFGRKPEIRAQDGAGKTLYGYAATFNNPSNTLNGAGGFVEVIRPGAFAASLARPDDVRFYINHEKYPILGRTTAGTLRLSEDATGLAFELDLPATGEGDALAVAVARGDVDEMSFGFRAIRDDWDYSQAVAMRVLLELELVEISALTVRAGYQNTAVAVRSLEQHRSQQPAPWQTNVRARELALRAKLASR